MTVEDGVAFFKAVPTIREKLETLQKVGLGYIKVGQSATTLSGGEAQRVKLAKELSKRATGRTLSILDEPTTGPRRSASWREREGTDAQIPVDPAPSTKKNNNNHK